MLLLEVLKMIYNKTASLITSSILIGSYIGGASIRDMDKINEWASVFEPNDKAEDFSGCKNLSDIETGGNSPSRGEIKDKNSKSCTLKESQINNY